MKLLELFAPPEEIFDPIQMADTNHQDSVGGDIQFKEKKQKTIPPGKNSNVAKGRRIKNLVRMHKRSTNDKNDDTHHQYNYGGHFSNFLQR